MVCSDVAARTIPSSTSTINNLLLCLKLFGKNFNFPNNSLSICKLNDDVNNPLATSLLLVLVDRLSDPSEEVSGEVKVKSGVKREMPRLSDSRVRMGVHCCEGRAEMLCAHVYEANW